MRRGCAVLPAAGAVFVLGLAGVSTPVLAASPVHYTCDDGLTLIANFSYDGETALLELPGGVRARLKAEGSASGMRFASGDYAFHGKRNEARFKRPGKPEVLCRVVKEQAAGEPEDLSSPSFTCTGSLTPTERQICDSSRLVGLDNRMAGLYEGLLRNMSAAARSELQQGQRDWLEERDGCGADEACLQKRYRERIAALEGYETAAAPRPPAATGGKPEFPHPAQSWGGLVRSGPGMSFDRQASLRKGEPLTLIEDTGFSMNGYNWFKIEYRGRTGYQWGGIICARNEPVPGTFQVCN